MSTQNYIYILILDFERIEGVRFISWLVLTNTLLVDTRCIQICVSYCGDLGYCLSPLLSPSCPQTAMSEASRQVGVTAGGAAHADFKNLLEEVAKYQGKIA